MPSSASDEAEVTSSIHVAGLHPSLILGTPEIPYSKVKRNILIERKRYCTHQKIYTSKYSITLEEQCPMGPE